MSACLRIGFDRVQDPVEALVPDNPFEVHIHLLSCFTGVFINLIVLQSVNNKATHER